MRIAIAGATGTVGRHVADAARRRGHDVISLTRSSGIDVLADHGIADALDGADALIDVLNTTTLATKKAVAYFSRTSRNLLRAGQRVGLGHHVALSIVGIDAIDTSYYAGKLAQERLVTASTMPHTIARTTQFHEFAAQIASQTSFGPITIAPRTLTRPVAAIEVGEHLVTVAEQPPRGRAPDLVGPADDTLAEMIRRLYANEGVRRRVVELRFPGPYGRGLASGSLRGGDGLRQVSTITFDQWLDSQARISNAGPGAGGDAS